MIRVTLFLAALALPVASPVSASTIGQMIGTWNGEGQTTPEGEPSQRIRCRIHLVPEGQATAMFTGRCATSQGQQDFSFLLIEDADGSVTAQNRSQPLDSLPLRMTGQAGAGALRIGDSEVGLFELRLDGDRLLMRIEGENAGRPAQAEATLTRR